MNVHSYAFVLLSPSRLRNFKESNPLIICRTAPNSESSVRKVFELELCAREGRNGENLASRLETPRSGNHTRSVGAKTKRAEVPITNLNSPEAVEHFRKVVTEWAKDAMRSKASARKAMIESGIWDESGKLTKTYRS